MQKMNPYLRLCCIFTDDDDHPKKDIHGLNAATVIALLLDEKMMPYESPQQKSISPTCDQFLYPKHKKRSVEEKKGGQKLKSISVLVPFEKVQASLSEIGFLLDDTVTIVTDGKFWSKMLYVKDNEMISVSEEIGDAYPKDPIITICGSKITISKVVKGIGG
jgi:hypothetical protein